MGKYIGPRTKIARKYGDPIFGPSKAFSKKNYAPGQHGKGKRKDVKEYSEQLNAKNKAKHIYDVRERQFHNLFILAEKSNGNTGTNLLELLESRLDNIVYRLGIAVSRASGRQCVSHKHITVNGKVVNIPSYRVKEGDIIAISKRGMKFNNLLVTRASNPTAIKVSWLEWDAKKLSGKLLTKPIREEIPEIINENAIVNFYSKC